VVYSNASIAMNASPRRRRNLEIFDPHGLVSLAISDPTGGAVRTKGPGRISIMKGIYFRIRDNLL
jgi:hypothetical protein